MRQMSSRLARGVRLIVDRLRKAPPLVEFFAGEDGPALAINNRRHQPIVIERISAKYLEFPTAANGARGGGRSQIHLK